MDRAGVRVRASRPTSPASPENEFGVSVTAVDLAEIDNAFLAVSWLPVITTRYNGASELLTPPEDGLVIHDPHDASELGEAITKMTDAAYRTRASTAARQAANRWTFEQHYQSLFGVLREASKIKRAA